nr:hypothetical protein [Tanacetum cinerariifolium]
MVAIDGVGFDWSYMAKDEVPTNMALIAFLNSKIDLSYSSLEEFQQPVFESYGPKSCKIESKNASENIPNKLKESTKVKESFDVPLVKKLVSDDMLEKKTIAPTSVNCNYHQRERVVSRNNYTRVNYNNSSRKTYPNAYRNIAPRAFLMKTILRPLNTARHVNTAHPKTTVYCARPMSHFSKLAQSTVKRPFQQRTTLNNKSFRPRQVNNARPRPVNTVRPRPINTARPNPAVVKAVRINQIWQTAVANTLDTKEIQIIATIDGNVKLISEASIRRHVKLEDSDGISTLPNTEIFEQLALMGHASNSDKLTFQKGMVKNLDSSSKFLMYPRFIQIFLNKHKRLLLPHKRTYVAPILTQKVFSNMRRASKGYARVDVPLFSTMLVQGIQGEGSTVLVESHHTPSGDPTISQPPLSSPSRVPTSPYDSPLPGGHTPGSDEGSLTLNELTILCTTLSNKVESLETELKLTKQTYGAAFTKLIKKLGVLSATKILADATRVHTYSRRRRAVSTGRGGVCTASRIISTAEETVSTASVSMPVLLLRERQERAGYEAAIRLQEQQDKEESQRISRYAEITHRLQEEIDAAERQRMAQVHQAAQTFTENEWENIRARVEADEELTQRLQVEEREKYSKDDRTKMLVNLINQRKKFYAHYTLKQLKKLSFEQIKEIFEATIRRIQDFVLMEREGDKEVSKFTGARGSKRDLKELNQGSSKKQKTDEASGSVQEQPVEEETELSQEDLQQLMIINPEQGMNVEALQVKYPIINWEIYTEDSKKYWKIIRVRNHTKAYQFFDDMMKVFDRDDLIQLWSLVKEGFSSTEPNDDKDRVLWVELKRLFEPDADDELWKL